MIAPRQYADQRGALFYLTCLFIGTIYIFGGANENEWFGNVLLLYIATPIFTLSIYKLLSFGIFSAEKIRILFGLTLALLVPLLQLVPLPHNIWLAVPFHDLAQRFLLTSGVNHPGGPLTLAPDLTWTSFLSLLPSITIFTTMLLFNREEKFAITQLVLICGAINAIFGLIQFSQNSNGALYLYPGLYAGDAVGFFKNRNHFASQMYSLLPFAVATLLKSLNFNFKSSRRGKMIINNSTFIFGLAYVFIFIVSCIFSKSRAGMILLMVALVWISFLPDWTNIQLLASEAGKKLYSKTYGLIVAFSVIFSLEYGFYHLTKRIETDNLSGMRTEIALNTLGAISRAFPYGTGLGTFQKVYAMIEPIDKIMPHTFVNRAHNDYLELILETGLAGLLIILGFLYWYLLQLRNAWRKNDDKDHNIVIARASCISLGLLLLHSLVDYPLRTQIMMVIFAMCCALLVDPVSDNEMIRTDYDESRPSNTAQRTRGEGKKRRSRVR